MRSGCGRPVDCRHVSARLERALLAAGERVIRVPAVMTGQARKVSRQAGKSDPIDARAVAPAVVRDGVNSFPIAFTDEPALAIRVLCDYRDQLISQRTLISNRLRWTGSRPPPTSRRRLASPPADINRRLLTDSGLTIEVQETVTMREPEGEATFWWVLAQRA